MSKSEPGWAYIRLPESISEKIFSFCKMIDKDDIYDPIDHGLEDNPHITLKYGLIVDHSSLVKECLSGKSGGVARLGVSSIFETEKYDVVKISASGSVLHSLHGHLNKLPHDDSHMIFKPHATIAYVKNGCGKKYVGKFSIDSEFSFDTIWFKKQDGYRSVPISLRIIKSFNLRYYLTAKKKSDKIPLTTKERAQVKSRFGDNLECSFFKDDDGYYCCTHRARSKSYQSIGKIPKSEVEFIGSTG